MSTALQGIKILDLTRVLAGPYATMILADLGADVVKIEMPEIGDDSRYFGPHINGESAYFMSINRNKRSMTLNLKKEEGKKLFLEMIKEFDVVVENFRPGTMERLGLGYDMLKTVNSELVYAAASGYGHTGPYSKRAAYDAVVQAMGGLMSITGEKGGKPTRVGSSIGDIAAGLFTAIGILTALTNRSVTGKGQMVDVAMLDCQVAILENAIARYTAGGEIPKPIGNRHSSIVPFEPFEARDGEIMIAVGNDAIWHKFCNTIEKAELIDDVKFCTNVLRHENHSLLKPIISEEIKKKTIKEWQNILDTAGVPNGPINTIDKVVKDPQIIAREMIVEVEHPIAGKVKIPGIPIKLSETPGEITRSAPLLGEHTKEVLKEVLGYDDNKIKSLFDCGIV
ncbi:MAG: CoA transferase [Clostridiales bacterium]|nr:CoA transferase [Clostridiales bacterium]